jgi:hypothetical protein
VKLSELFGDGILCHGSDGAALAADTAVVAIPSELGYQLDEKPLNGRWVWAWRCGDDERHPCFLTET